MRKERFSRSQHGGKLSDQQVASCFPTNPWQKALPSVASRSIWRQAKSSETDARLRLSGQPSQVLLILVLRAGQLVTREELRLQLWLLETFVDFDHGLNNCINRIRDALGDSAASPRFIETLPASRVTVSSRLSRSCRRPNPRRAPPPSPPEEPPTGAGCSRISQPGPAALPESRGDFQPCGGC